MAVTYKCPDCGGTIRLTKKPSCCPFCGKEGIGRDNGRAKQYAERVLRELNDMLPQIEDAWKSYVEQYVEFENRRRNLSQYVSRGIIEKSEIPKLERKNLQEELKEYRLRKNETNCQSGNDIIDGK